MTGISDWGRSLRSTYENPSTWPPYDPSVKADIYRFASLWLTEGIPFVFRDYPMLFAYSRQRLGDILETDPKNISLTGSARLGFSMNPRKFGVPWASKNSDLDLFVVSNLWFNYLVSDFQLFASRYSAGLEQPYNTNEGVYFSQNVNETPDTIRRGFIDQKRIPNRKRYERAVALARAADQLSRIINREMPPDCAIRKVSIRVYSEWPRVISQIGGSLIMAIKEFHSQPPAHAGSVDP